MRTWAELSADLARARQAGDERKGKARDGSAGVGVGGRTPTAMANAVMTRVGTPLASTAAWRFIAFMTVASILRGGEERVGDWRQARGLLRTAQNTRAAVGTRWGSGSVQVQVKRAPRTPRTPRTRM